MSVDYDEGVCVESDIGDTGHQHQLQSKAFPLMLKMKPFAARPCVKEALDTTTKLEGSNGGK
jgi:hypothetical protein